MQQQKSARRLLTWACAILTYCCTPLSFAQGVIAPIEFVQGSHTQAWPCGSNSEFHSCALGTLLTAIAGLSDQSAEKRPLLREIAFEIHFDKNSAALKEQWLAQFKTVHPQSLLTDASAAYRALHNNTSPPEGWHDQIHREIFFQFLLKNDFNRALPLLTPAVAALAFGFPAREAYYMRLNQQVENQQATAFKTEKIKQIVKLDIPYQTPELLKLARAEIVGGNISTGLETLANIPLTNDDPDQYHYQYQSLAALAEALKHEQKALAIGSHLCAHPRQTTQINLDTLLSPKFASSLIAVNQLPSRELQTEFLNHLGLAIFQQHACAWLGHAFNVHAIRINLRAIKKGPTITLANALLTQLRNTRWFSLYAEQ